MVQLAKEITGTKSSLCFFAPERFNFTIPSENRQKSTILADIFKNPNFLARYFHASSQRRMIGYCLEF